MMSTPPSNSMNAVSGTLGMDLPVNSRYMGTVSYSGARQNEQFLPFSIRNMQEMKEGRGKHRITVERSTGQKVASFLGVTPVPSETLPPASTSRGGSFKPRKSKYGY